jgi:hypothetical protein
MLFKGKDDTEVQEAEIRLLESIVDLTDAERKTLSKEAAKFEKGDWGEREAAWYLDPEARDKPQRHLIHDLRVAVDGEWVQFDHVLWNNCGDFYLLETKSYSNITIDGTGSCTVWYRKHPVDREAPHIQLRRQERLFNQLLKTDPAFRELVPSFSTFQYVIVPPTARLKIAPEYRDIYRKMDGFMDQYPMRTLVAFSGEVNDPESGPDGFSENSHTLNPHLNGREIREAFKGDEYQILLVANKFQTGFDQPLLCGMYVDRRLAGIQAVQTLSRLNRAHPGKDTTYVVDFVNDTADVLAAFKAYHTTVELSATTDPNLVYNLRAKLDAAGHYDDFEVDRVVTAELKPGAKQGELLAAITPVEDRLMKSYKAAQEALKVAKETNNDGAAKIAKDEMDALILFKNDMGAFLRLYTFLSQIFDYGNTAIEKRAIFYKRLLPLLEFGREREGIDLSKVVLTHYNLRNLGKRAMPLGGGETPKLDPITEAGSGAVQEQQKVYMGELISKLNELFGAETTDQDQLVYVNHVIKGKLLESETLRQQATNNTKEQFANSPDLKTELLNAIMGALDAHTSMSTQALNSPTVQSGIKDILLNHSGLWETLRAKKAS